MRILTFLLTLATTTLADLTDEQRRIPLGVPPANSTHAATQIILLAGTPSNKPGQHEYFAGCALLQKWLSQIPGICPIMIPNGWPEDESVFDSASSILFFMDGGDKLPFLTPERRGRIQSHVDAGTGLVVLHQGIDCPTDLAPSFKQWFGAAFQSDIGCRGHWDVEFSTIPTHPITQGLQPFALPKDGWLYNLHFAETGVTPVLTCLMPDTSRKTPHAKAHSGREETVAWAYERPNGGRSFGFTGCDLHSNFGEPNQRRLLLNALLWTAKQTIPPEGTNSTVTAEELKQNWDRKIFQPKAKTAPEKAP
jgi:Trehalose utilisation